MRRSPVLIALLALTLIACGGTPGPGATATPPPSPSPTAPATASPGGGSLDEIIGDWQLESGVLDGEPVPIVPQAPITLTVNAIRVSGTSACNSYGADWILGDDGSLRLDEINMTLMLCEEPVNASETAYLAALGRTNSVTMDGEQLVMAGPGSELRFVRTDG
jgi:heat shock protein HslJ